MEVARKSMRRYNSDTRVHQGRSYENNYSLNVGKSLRKKLESTQRSDIIYQNTHGGYTAKYDAVSFELFIYACEQLFNEKKKDVYYCDKTTATDRQGNIVQYTFQISGKIQDTNFTINVYLTKCSVLINGKNSKEFMENDINEIHKIMSNTTINGAKINIQMTNDNLAMSLKRAISLMENEAISSEKKSIEDAQKKEVEKCSKCKRTCKTRAVECINGHWIHYTCDKLSEEEIQSVEASDETYICKSCKECSPKQNKCIDLSTIGDLIHNCTDNSIAKFILNEEVQCQACDDTSCDDRCDTCLREFHSKCLETETKTCYACVGLNKQEQDNEQLNPPYIYIHESETEEVTPVCGQLKPTEMNEQENKKDTLIRTHISQNRVEKITSESLQLSQHKKIPLSDGQPEKSKDENQILMHNNKMKELRQLEQKLKKKEEQLKIKESMLNEDMKAKTIIMDRLHKAELKNLELEHTIQTLHAKIETMKKDSTAKQHNNCYSNQSLPDETDELVIGMRKRITKYVLNKIDIELDKLEQPTVNERIPQRSNQAENLNASSAINREQNYNNVGKITEPSHHHLAEGYQQYTYSNNYPNYYMDYPDSSMCNSFDFSTEHYHSYDNASRYTEPQNICDENLIKIYPQENIGYVPDKGTEQHEYSRSFNVRTTVQNDSHKHGSEKRNIKCYNSTSQLRPCVADLTKGQPIYYQPKNNSNFLYQRQSNITRYKY